MAPKRRNRSGGWATEDGQEPSAPRDRRRRHAEVVGQDLRRLAAVADRSAGRVLHEDHEIENTITDVRMIGDHKRRCTDSDPALEPPRPVARVGSCGLGMESSAESSGPRRTPSHERAGRPKRPLSPPSSSVALVYTKPRWA